MLRPRTIPQPVRFLVIGGVATLTHLACALALTRAMPEASLYAVNAAAFAVAFFVSFYGHTHVTFRRGGSMMKFLVVAIAGFALNNLLLNGAKRLGASHEWALALAIGLVPVFTYIASSLWAFAVRRPTSTED